MARRQEPLDEEQRALHDSWDTMARTLARVAVNSVLIWGVCSALRYGVHASSDRLLAFVAEAGVWWAPGMLVGLLVAGGLLRGLLNRRPGWNEVASDGVDVALSNYHITYQDAADDPRPRYSLPAFGLAFRKAAATLLTLGTGASGGLEGPVVLVGESMGAGLARITRARSEHTLRTCQLAGIAAAVGTLLNTPFAAALFALEVVYGNRIVYRKLAYCLFAGIITYALNNRFLGFRPIFVAPPHGHTYTLAEYALTALVAVAISAPVALALGLTMKHTRQLVERVHPVLRGAAGSLFTAVVAVGLFYGLRMDPRHVLGMGEYTIARLLAGDGGALSLWWFLLLIVVGKLFTTGFTIQSGGSAGMLIPSMVLGGVSGAATAQLLAAATGLTLSPQLFVVVGIASALVAVVGVPLAAIALVLEVFGSEYGPPAVLACGVTYVLTLRLSIYQQQLREPAAQVAEAPAGS
ncbi:voltage-gated chloride channel [Archangium sp. Cb G35]|uniref:chloride channel protein n=1 Tax=Archangium sp. Cb G35 TaxID=1920190 RepID=UPI000936283E|nr:chloride channel protein [Archangium sp. Cb G35]OJT20795.1 voltage-gated chloride channel [Archangium sp. Cb G35]